MAGKILAVGLGEDSSEAVLTIGSSLGLEVVQSPWKGFDLKRIGRTKLDIALIDRDSQDALALDEFCRQIRHRHGQDFPVLVLTKSTRFADLADLTDLGATDILGNPPEPVALLRKMTRWLNRNQESPQHLDGEAPPDGLVRAFSRAGAQSRLADFADIYPGVAPRRTTFKRQAPPDRNWRGVIPAASLGQFHISRQREYLSWNRLHLFRLPDSSEYDVPEKVVLAQAGPPLAAALDRSRLPLGHGLYAIVPKPGVSAGFIAAALNSRLVDFYYNRLVMIRGVGLRLQDIRSLPLPLPGKQEQTELSRSAVLLSHFGPNPSDWVDRQRREEMREAVEAAVFDLYGVKSGEREELAALHF